MYAPHTVFVELRHDAALGKSPIVEDLAKAEYEICLPVNSFLVSIDFKQAFLEGEQPERPLSLPLCRTQRKTQCEQRNPVLLRCTRKAATKNEPPRKAAHPALSSCSCPALAEHPTRVPRRSRSPVFLRAQAARTGDSACQDNVALPDNSRMRDPPRRRTQVPW